MIVVPAGWTLHLGPPPTKPLSLNRERQLHWAARNRRLHPWRDLAWAAALHGHLRQAVEGAPCTITVVLPVEGRRRRDPHNYVPVAKAVVDGLVLARVWPDDTPDHVTVTEPVLWHESHAEVRLVPRDPRPESPRETAA